MVVLMSPEWLALEGSVNKVQKRASVAPSTVEDIGRGKEIKVAKRVRRTPSNSGVPGRPASYHHKMDKRVWRTAMKIAKGNRQLIEVVAPDEVIVHNHAGWKGYR